MNYNKIKILSTEKRLSFTQLSKIIGMSRGGLYAAIDNETLTIDTLEKIAKAFDVPIISFFENEPGGLISGSEFDKHDLKIKVLKEEVSKLKKENDNLNLLIDFIKEKNLLDSDKIQNRNNKELDDETRRPLSSLFTEFEEDAESEIQKEVFRYFNSDNVIYKTKDEKLKALIKWFQDVNTEKI